MMKLKLFFWLISAVLLVQSCSYPKYLPKFKDIETNVYGSQIYVQDNLHYDWTEGELMAISDTSLLLLQNVVVNKISVDTLIEIGFKDINKYHLYVAKPENYAPSLLVNNLLTLSHGFFMIFTLPVNLITTVSVVAGGNKAYKLTDKQLNNFRELSKYSRFPAGIPPGFRLGLNEKPVNLPNNIIN